MGSSPIPNDLPSLPFPNGVAEPLPPSFNWTSPKPGNFSKCSTKFPVYLVNDPEQAIEWTSGELLGVSDFIPLPQTERLGPFAKSGTNPKTNPNLFDEPEYEGPPIEVEGSTEYLRLILPSTEHPGYKQVLRLMREWSFLRDRNHSHWWWLRDSSKVLDFLATHQKELELDHEAEFTDNFRNLTSGIKRAELRASATETGDGAEVEVRIVAGDVPPDELEHALATGQNHVRHGQKVYLLTR